MEHAAAVVQTKFEAYAAGMGHALVNALEPVGLQRPLIEMVLSFTPIAVAETTFPPTWTSVSFSFDDPQAALGWAAASANAPNFEGITAAATVAAPPKPRWCLLS